MIKQLLFVVFVCSSLAVHAQKDTTNITSNIKFRKTDTTWHLPQKFWFNYTPLSLGGSLNSKNLMFATDLAVYFMFMPKRLISIKSSIGSEVAFFDFARDFVSVDLAYGYYYQKKHGFFLASVGLGYINYSQNTNVKKHFRSSALFVTLTT